MRHCQSHNRPEGWVLLTHEGQVTLPNRMNFRKSSKGGRSYLQSKIHIADFGNFKQGFLSMKLLQKRVNSGFRVCFVNNCIEKKQNKTHFEESPPWDLFENLSVMEAPSLPNRTLSYFGSGLQVQSPYLWISRACISYYRALIPPSNRIHYKKIAK